METLATIQKQKTKRGSSKIVFIGAMSADVVILWVGAILGGGRQREEKKNEKNIQRPENVYAKGFEQNLRRMPKKQKRKNEKVFRPV